MNSDRTSRRSLLNWLAIGALMGIAWALLTGDPEIDPTPSPMVGGYGGPGGYGTPIPSPPVGYVLPEGYSMPGPAGPGGAGDGSFSIRSDAAGGGVISDGQGNVDLSFRNSSGGYTSWGSGTGSASGE